MFDSASLKTSSLSDTMINCGWKASKSALVRMLRS